MDMKDVKKFARLKAKIKEVEATAKQLRAEAKELGDRLMADFVQDGVTQVRVGGNLVFIKTTLWGGAAPDADGRVTETEKRAMIKALKRAGPAWHSLVGETVNSQTLSAALRERPKDKRGMPILPPTLAATIKVTDKTELAVRKSK